MSAETYQLVVLGINCIAIVTSVVIAAKSASRADKSLIIAEKSFLADHERRKKQATIEFTHGILELRNPLWLQIKAVFGDAVINVDDSRYKDNEELKETINQYLRLMERVAVGINTGVYDLHVYTRIIGSGTVRTYKKLLPIIEYEREAPPRNPNLYIEYENLVKDIETEQMRIRPTPTAGNIVYSRINEKL